MKRHQLTSLLVSSLLFLIPAVSLCEGEIIATPSTQVTPDANTSTPVPAASPTAAPQPTNDGVPSSTPGISPTPSATPAPTATSAATAVPPTEPTVSPVPSATPDFTPAPTATPGDIPTSSPVASATPDVSPAPTATGAPVPTATPDAIPTPDASPVLTKLDAKVYHPSAIYRDREWYVTLGATQGLSIYWSKVQGAEKYRSALIFDQKTVQSRETTSLHDGFDPGVIRSGQYVVRVQATGQSGILQSESLIVNITRADAAPTSSPAATSSPAPTLSPGPTVMPQPTPTTEPTETADPAASPVPSVQPTSTPMPSQSPAPSTAPQQSPGGGRPSGNRRPSFNFNAGKFTGNAGSESDTGFTVTPGSSFATAHSSGNRDMTYYDCVRLIVPTAPVSVLTLDDATLDAYFECGSEFTVTISQNMLNITAAEQDNWCITLSTLELLYRSGIEQINILSGDYTLSIPTDLTVSGREWGKKRSMGYVSKDLQLVYHPQQVNGYLDGAEYSLINGELIKQED